MKPNPGKWFGFWRLEQWCAVGLVLAINGLLWSSADATERTRPLQIAALTASWGPTPMIVGMRDGLLGFGYRENDDFFLGVRFTQGNIKALPAAARELVDHGADLIFVDSDAAAKAAQRSTTRVPIVFASVSDPTGLGLIRSFARPGGNITGVTDLELELGPKRLEVLREMIPNLKKVLFVHDATEAYAVRMAKVYLDATRKVGIELVERAVRTEKRVRATLSQLRKDGIDGILAPRSSALNIQGFIMEAASQQAIPAIFSATFFPKHGGLASYAPDSYETGKQAAHLVDKILKGAEPGELPVEVNRKIEFVINLITAKKMNLQIPPRVLYRANQLVR